MEELYEVTPQLGEELVPSQEPQDLPIWEVTVWVDQTGAFRYNSFHRMGAAVEEIAIDDHIIETIARASADAVRNSLGEFRQELVELSQRGV